MEVVPRIKRLPFQRRDVEEWSRLDSITGALETARVETDRWAATTSSSAHHYGQVVDSRARNLADGSKEQRQQRKQLEVFQANIPGGTLQVIRTQTTTSSWHGQSTASKLDSNLSVGWPRTGNSSSSKTKTTESRTTDQINNRSKNDEETRTRDEHFENLKLALNPLDLSSQKTKASIGRSGSISSRRPPSRPRSIAGTGHGISEDNSKITTIKEQQQQQKWQSSSASSLVSKAFHSESKSVFKQESTSSSLHSTNRRTELSSKPISLFPVTNDARTHISTADLVKETERNTKPILFRMKSCSSEDVRLSPDDEDKETETETNGDWRRYSKERRSLQLPPVQPKADKMQNLKNHFETRSVIKLGSTSRSETEDMKLSVVDKLKGMQWKSIEDVLKRNVDSNLTGSRHSFVDREEGGEAIEATADGGTRTPIRKRNSFITVESLNEVRGRLRRMGSSSDVAANDVNDPDKNRSEQVDDGILTESKDISPANGLDSDSKSVKSYIYGMEALLRSEKRSMTGTGSLETRGSNKAYGNTSISSRTEEWYNRRKSYGFEPVSQQQQPHQQTPVNNRYSIYGDNKINIVESTDSGICRSTETVVPSTLWYRPAITGNTNNTNLKTSHTITITGAYNNDSVNTDSQPTDEMKSSYKPETLNSSYVPKGSKTVVTLGTEDQDKLKWRRSPHFDDLNSDDSKPINVASSTNASPVSTAITTSILHSPSDDSKEVITRGKVADALRSLRQKTSLTNSFEARRLSEPITISIPPSNNETTENSESNGLLLKQTKEPSTTDKYKFNKTINGDAGQIQTSYSKLIFGESKTKSFDRNSSENRDSNNESDSSLSRHFMLRPISKSNHPEFKRHSIAVDEAKYMKSSKNEDKFELSSIMKDNRAQFENNNREQDAVSMGKIFVTTDIRNSTATIEQKRNYKNDLDPNRNNAKPESSSDNDCDPNSNEKKQKKVEFCKTEVHFAAEPGRFNIVETDGKPPPSNVSFRRRRRTIAESPIRTNLPKIHFGDSQYEKILLTHNKTEKLDSNSITSQPIQRSRSNSPLFIDNKEINIESKMNSLNDVNEVGLPLTINYKCQTDDEEQESDSKQTCVKSVEINVDENDVRPRSILKHNIMSRQQGLIKNESYDSNSDSNEERLKSSCAVVKLNPVLPLQAHITDSHKLQTTSTSSTAIHTSISQKSVKEQRSTSTTTITSTPTIATNLSDAEQKVETELQKLLKSLRPTPRKPILLNTDDEFIDTNTPSLCVSELTQASSSAADNGLAVHITSKPTAAWNHQQKAPVSVTEKVQHIDDFRMKGFSTRINFGAGEAMVVSPDQHNDHNNYSDWTSGNCLTNGITSNRLQRVLSASDIVSQSKKKPSDVPVIGLATSNVPLHNTASDQPGVARLKSVETLVSTRSGHPRITSISLRYNDTRDDNQNRYSAPAYSSNKYSKSSSSIDSDLNSSTTDVSSSWKWSNGVNRSAKTTSSTQSISLSSIGTATTIPLGDATVKEEHSYESKSTNQESIGSHSSYYNNKKSTQIVRSSGKQQSIHTQSSGDQQRLRRGGEQLQFSKITAVVSPTIASSNLLTHDYANLQQIAARKPQTVERSNVDNVTHSLQVTATSRTKRSESGRIDSANKSKCSDQNGVKKENLQKCVTASSSGRDGWLNVRKNSPQPHHQQEHTRIEKQSKKQSSIIDMKRERKSSFSDDHKVKTNHYTSDDINNTISTRTGVESPIYENGRIYSHESLDVPCDRTETESFILEELTRAADEILLAVNGYTDEESFKGSSDDEHFRRHGKEKKPVTKSLGTISEMPSKKEKGNAASKTSVSSKQSSRTGMSASRSNRLCKTSSNSSVEGSSVESKPLILEKPSKRRAVRLLQRANSREMLLKNISGGASSSEDIPSSSELADQRITRTRTSRHTSHQKSTVASLSRTKDRVQRTVSSVDNTSSKTPTAIIAPTNTAAARSRRHDERKKSNAVKSRTSIATSTTSAGIRKIVPSERTANERSEQKPSSGRRDVVQRREGSARGRHEGRNARPQSNALIRKKSSSSLSQTEELAHK